MRLSVLTDKFKASLVIKNDFKQRFEVPVVLPLNKVNNANEMIA